MEGRPPSFDDDDELDFDFGASRERHPETGEVPLPRRRIPGPYEGEELPSEEYPASAEDDPFADSEPEQEESPPARERRGGGLIGTLLGGGRRRERGGRRERGRRRETGERPAVTGEPETGERLLRDDPFTPAEVPVPGSRRRHRRDLPAKVRRRQAIAIGAAAVVLVGGAVIAFGGGGGGDDDEALALKKLIGQTVITRLAEETPTPALLERARKGQIGGVIVAPRQAIADEQALQQGLSQLQAAAAEGDNPPLLVMIDQEGGDIRRLPGPPDVSPPDLGSDGDPEAARVQGDQTGAYLKPLGVDVDLAPVLDVELSQTADTIASRTFGDDPALVAGLGVAFIEGLQSQQVAATAKHFPGLGPATINTDFSPVTVVATQEEFDAALEPFRAAVEDGVDLVMMSSAAYPSLAGAPPGQGRVTPAVFAEPIVQGMLRQQLGFDGVVITDDLESIAIQELTEGDVAGVSALGAGCDLLLWARSERGSVRGFNAIVRASKRETLTRDRLQQSYDRIVALKRTLAAED
jgi:beta-N-acetylhexosaminidase